MRLFRGIPGGVLKAFHEVLEVQTVTIRMRKDMIKFIRYGNLRFKLAILRLFTE